MPIITTSVTDPEGEFIITGTLTFVATETSGTVLKGTYASTTPGVAITLLNGTYKVYHTDAEDSIKRYVGEITVAEAATLISLLS